MIETSQTEVVDVEYVTNKAEKEFNKTLKKSKFYEWYAYEEFLGIGADGQRKHDDSGYVKMIENKIEFIKALDEEDFNFPLIGAIYTGNWEPTFESGHGKNYIRFDKILLDIIEDIILALYPDTFSDDADKRDNLDVYTELDRYSFDIYDDLCDSYTKEKLLTVLQKKHRYFMR
ncbi:MAG: hypothetical protein LBN09_05430 [Clostridioides sp.]|nr:hypothetical protein [Clostridioides sp.]